MSIQENLCFGITMPSSASQNWQTACVFFPDLWLLSHWVMEKEREKMNCVGENVTQLYGRPQVFLRKWLRSGQRGIPGTGQEWREECFYLSDPMSTLILAHESELLISCVVLGTIFQSSLFKNTPRIPETKLKSSPVKTPTFEHKVIFYSWLGEWFSWRPFVSNC